jgi:hypothetical protein
MSAWLLPIEFPIPEGFAGILGIHAYSAGPAGRNPRAALSDYVDSGLAGRQDALRFRERCDGSNDPEFAHPDGALAVTFTPELNPEQYLRLHDVVYDAETTEELQKVAKMAALKWGVEVQFD